MVRSLFFMARPAAGTSPSSHRVMSRVEHCYGMMTLREAITELALAALDWSPSTALRETVLGTINARGFVDIGEAAMDGLGSNPLGILTFIVAPAILTNASS